MTPFSYDVTCYRRLDGLWVHFSPALCLVSVASTEEESSMIFQSALDYIESRRAFFHRHLWN